MIILKYFYAVMFFIVATISFSSATYQYDEGAGDILITVTRSGNIESKAFVSVASNIFQGTAAGRAT